MLELKYEPTTKSAAKPKAKAGPRVKTQQPTICIDFDGVICLHVSGRSGMGEPAPLCKETMQQLIDNGNHVVVFTSRGGQPEHVIDWLNYYEIPFHTVTNVKPASGVWAYVDDKAIRHVDWHQTRDMLKLYEPVSERTIANDK